MYKRCPRKRAGLIVAWLYEGVLLNKYQSISSVKANRLGLAIEPLKISLTRITLCCRNTEEYLRILIKALMSELQ